MTFSTIFVHDLPRRSDRNEHIRRQSASGTTLYWHDSNLRSASQGYWAPPELATTGSSSASTPCSGVSVKLTTSLSIKEPRRSYLMPKLILGLSLLRTGFRRKSNDPPSARQKYQRLLSTSCVDVSSLNASYSPRSYRQASHQSLQDKP